MNIKVPSFPIFRSKKEKDIIDELNTKNSKILVIGLVPHDKNKMPQDCIVYCPKDGHGISVKSIKNVKQNTGCFYCGTRAGKYISDENFVRERLSGRLNKKEIRKIITKRDDKRNKDRTNMFVTLETERYTITSRQKSLNTHIEKFEDKIKCISTLHGDYVEVKFKFEDNKTHFLAKCKLGGHQSDHYQTVIRWIPRAESENRKKIRKSKSDLEGVNYFEELIDKHKKESKPSLLVRRLMSEYTHGLKQVREATFPGLGGEKRPLRVDLYYPKQKVVIEVQSSIHTKKIIDHFGGEEGMKIRQEYDKRKREFFQKHKNEYSFYEVNGEASQSDIESQLKKIVSIHFNSIDND